MKKIIALLLVCVMAIGVFAGCANTKDPVKDPTEKPTVNQPTDTQDPTGDITEPEGTGDSTDPSGDATEGTGDVTEPEVELTETETMLNKLIEKQPMQFPTLVMPIDLADEFALNGYTGLESKDHIVEASFCESAMGSQAFSLVLVKVDDAANAEAVAKAIQEKVDLRKWICVAADDLMVVATGEYVLLAMMDSEFKTDATAKSTTDLFAQEFGELSVTLTGKPE
ncbi:MAG: hypothetical protein IJZ68_06295 [Bacteroidaceae bacterium]|nr:hypothetical protein [Bacteroidaceae bacterium]